VPAAGGVYPVTATTVDKGSSNATRLVLTISVPAALGVSDLDPACSFSQHAIVCNYGGLPPGQSLVTPFSVVPSTNGSFAIPGTIAASQSDPFSRNNHSVAHVVVR